VVGDLGAIDIRTADVGGTADALIADGKLDGVVCTGLRGEEGRQEDVLVCLVGGEVRVSHGELVEGEGAGLVRAENGDASQLLDGGETLDNDVLLGELLRANGHRDRQHRGETDGNGGDDEDENLLESGADVEVLVANEDTDEDACEDDGDNDEEVADDIDHLLEVALLVGDGDEVGGTTDKGVGTGLGDDGDLLTDLDDG